MARSKHSEIRSQQRGIPFEMMDVILEHGVKSRRPGGVWEYRITKKGKNETIRRLKHQINLVEKSTGKAVLLANDDRTVITVYHSL